MKTKAVLFDMDGVLIDSEPLHTVARANMFPKLGIPLETEKEIVLGASKFNYWSLFSEKFNLPYTAHQLIDMEFEEILAIVKANNTPESLHLSDVLKTLTENGVKVAVGSSSNRYFVSGVLEHLGIAKYFTTLVCGGEVKNPKPDPETYLTAAERLGVKPEECFVVEDSRTGSLAAKNAGIRCVGYRGTEVAKKTDFSACVTVIEDMADLLKVVEL